MARPIREIPILTGEDATRFVVEMQKVDNMTSEHRPSNHKQFQKDLNSALDTIFVLIHQLLGFLQLMRTFQLLNFTRNVDLLNLLRKKRMSIHV